MPGRIDVIYGLIIERIFAYIIFVYVFPAAVILPLVSCVSAGPYTIVLTFMPVPVPVTMKMPTAWR